MGFSGADRLKRSHKAFYARARKVLNGSTWQPPHDDLIQEEKQLLEKVGRLLRTEVTTSVKGEG